MVAWLMEGKPKQSLFLNIRKYCKVLEGHVYMGVVFQTMVMVGNLRTCNRADVKDIGKMMIPKVHKRLPKAELGKHWRRKNLTR